MRQGEGRQHPPCPHDHLHHENRLISSPSPVAGRRPSARPSEIPIAPRREERAGVGSGRSAEILLVLELSGRLAEISADLIDLAEASEVVRKLPPHPLSPSRSFKGEGDDLYWRSASAISASTPPRRPPRQGPRPSAVRNPWICSAASRPSRIAQTTKARPAHDVARGEHAVRGRLVIMLRWSIFIVPQRVTAEAGRVEQAAGRSLRDRSPAPSAPGRPRA